MGYERVDRDEPLEDEKELWAVGTMKLPKYLIFNKNAKKLVELMKNREGLVGVHQHERGTLWLFETENQAIRARNLIKAEGFGVSKQIGKVFVPK